MRRASLFERRRALAAGLAASTVGLLALGGCGSSHKPAAKVPVSHSASGVPFPLTSKVTITVMTNPVTWEGFTKSTSSGSNSIASFYNYYHAIWAKELPNLTIKEEQVPNETDEVTKTLLGVESHNAPDLVAFDTPLPQLVSRGGLMDLSSLYKQAGLSASSMLPALTAYSQYGGKIYAMPGASDPIVPSLLYIPSIVKKAGLNPNAMPKTWAQLMQASQKVVKWGPGHVLERVGEEVQAPNTSMSDIASYCNSNTALWNASTGWHLNAPCVLAFYNYQLALVKLYGGWTGYEKFVSGDPGPWSCSKSDYAIQGKLLLDLNAYWTGGQYDHCYNVNWALSPGPTMNGTLAEASHLQTTAWFVAIPKGTSTADAEAAFDLWYVTIYQHGNLDGPTTNGYVRASTAPSWWKDLVSTQAALRKKNGYPGNPMASVVPMEEAESNVARWSYPESTITSDVITAMNNAWNNVVFHHETVAKAFGSAQSDIQHEQSTTTGGKDAG